MRRAALIVLFAVIPLASHAQSPRILSHWVQLEAGGAVEARAVVEGTSCPKLIIDGQAAPMAIRAAASAEFAQVCAGSIPDGARSVAMADAVLPLPLREPERILVFGDTGCRIKGSAIQACNDPKQWPFPVLAAAAAKLKPDLVIHVGDYLYRENACPSGNAGCAGTPFGDNWPTWNADFFGAAQPLLSVAPAVFVRGNHEDCQRAGIGWMRMLGPYPYDPAAPCSMHQPPYTAHVSGAILGIVDNASAPDTSIDANAASNFHDDIAALASLSQPLWLVMHKPIWGVVSGPLGLPVGGNATMISAVENREHTFPSPVKLMLTGHIHAFQAINYKDAIPPQIIAGRGGTKLDTTPADLRGAIFQGSSVAVKDGLSVDGFGFLLMTKLKDRWTIDLYDAGATYERQCVFAAGRVDCPMPPK